MSEIVPILVLIIQLLNFLFIGLLIPFFRHMFDVRLKIERIEVILNTILKDVEQLKKEVYNGEDNED